MDCILLYCHSSSSARGGQEQLSTPVDMLSPHLERESTQDLHSFFPLQSRDTSLYAEQVDQIQSFEGVRPENFKYIHMVVGW